MLVGEVFTMNDDVADGVFLESVGRFTAIRDDTAPFRLAVSDRAARLRG